MLLKEGLDINQSKQLMIVPSLDPFDWMTRRELLKSPQLTDLYKEELQIKRLPLAIEGIMKGVVSEILEDKLSQKFKPIEERLTTIEEHLQEFAPKVVVREIISKEEAKKRIKDYIAKTDKEFYPDEIADQLHLDFQLVMTIVSELIDEQAIKVKE